MLLHDRMAPEYLMGKTEYNSSCDIYSFGKKQEADCNLMLSSRPCAERSFASALDVIKE